MYYIQNTKSNQDKIVSGIVTTILLFTFYFLLRWMTVPDVKHRTDSYEEINWTKFDPKPEKITEKPAPVELEKPTRIEKPPEEPNRVQKIDLSSLKDLSLGTLTPPSKSLKKKPVKKESSSDSNLDLQIELKNSNLLSGLNTMLGESSRKLNLPRKAGRGSRKESKPTLVAKSGNAIKVGSNTNYGRDDLTLGAPETKSANGKAVQIDLMDLGQMRSGFADLSPIYRALVEWMKRHPTEFPEVVNRFMEKMPGDLTSVINFQIGQRQFQMYLLCKEKLYEVRISLIEGNQSTYLIDRGFKEKSSYLRVGAVNRTANGNILSFGTTRQAASDQRTAQFYQIFLSWWESIKPEVQQFL
jgi:hypothetical protein